MDHAKCHKARIQLVMCDDTAAMIHSEQLLTYEASTSNVKHRSKVCISDADTHFTVTSNVKHRSKVCISDADTHFTVESNEG
jgi:hypothetical protein